MRIDETNNEFSTYEAKSHLSQLLNRVAQGGSFTITRQGKPVAQLVSVASSPQAAPARVRARRAEIKGEPLAELLTYAHEGHKR